MVTTESLPTVVDAGPIIHLDELGCLDLLCDLTPVVVPCLVLVEASRHRPLLNLQLFPDIESVRVSDPIPDHIQQLGEDFDLGIGEMSALVYMTYHSCRFFITDDAAARLAAEQLGWRVHGTVGLIVRAVRQKLRSREQVCDILSAIRSRSSLHISQDILDAAIRNVMTVRP